jgi:hypothetical protein
MRRAHGALCFNAERALPQKTWRDSSFGGNKSPAFPFL